MDLGPIRASATSSRPGTAARTSSSGPGVGRSLRLCTAMSTNPSRTCALDLLGEQPRPADGSQSRVAVAVSLGVDRDEFHIQARMTAAQAVRNPFGLPTRQAAAASANPQGQRFDRCAAHGRAVSESSRQDSDDDALCPGLLECSSCCAAGGAGGEDVIDKQDGSAIQAGIGPGRRPAAWRPCGPRRPCAPGDRWP